METEYVKFIVHPPIIHFYFPSWKSYFCLFTIFPVLSLPISIPSLNSPHDTTATSILNMFTPPPTTGYQLLKQKNFVDNLFP